MRETVSFEKIEGFDWDDGNWPKCGKHGVSREEIEQLFDLDPYILPDEKHSVDEQRFLAIGRILSGRHVFAAFTIREAVGRRKIRPISARYMHANEVRKYEELRQKFEKDSGIPDG